VPSLKSSVRPDASRLITRYLAIKMAERDESGRFLPGSGSANPGGRPKGQVLLQTRLREQLESLAPNAIEHLGKMVKRGNVIAIRLLVEKLIPTPKSGPVAAPIYLEGSAVEQAERVVAAMSAGSITLEDGIALMSAITGAQRIRDSAALADRVSEIEARLAALTGATPPAQLGSPSVALPAPKADGDAQ
jgi:hypothetical protein